MIQTNVSKLISMDWEDIRGDLRVSSDDNNEVAGYLNLMVNESSGEILEIAPHTRVYENMAVSYVKLKEGAGEHFELELLDERKELPEAISKIVMESFDSFNKIKLEK